MSLRFLFPFFLLFSLIQAESVKSITGNIIFDISNDGTSEAKLTSDGLAIGDGLSPSSNLHLQGNGIITGDLVVGGTAGNSTLEVQGTIGYAHQTISSNTTLSGNSVILVDTSSDNVTVTLPYAGNVMGRLYTIKKISTSNQVTLEGGGNLIDANINYTFTSGNTAFLKIISNGSKWNVLASDDDGLNSLPDFNISYSFDIQPSTGNWADSTGEELIDGTTNTSDTSNIVGWDDTANGENPTITFDLGAVYDVQSIDFWTRTSWGTVNSIDIATSTDGVTFSANTNYVPSWVGGNPGTETLDISALSSARYIRIYSQTNDWTMYSEIKFNL